MFYYSHIGKRKSFSERFSWVLTLKMDFEYRKMPIFKGVASNRFTRYQKILWACLLGCKKLLNFICLPMKFHDRHHVNVYPMYVHCLAIRTNFLGFFIQNTHTRQVRKLPKHYVKFPNFSSIACINVGSFSMSFGCQHF